MPRKDQQSRLKLGVLIAIVIGIVIGTVLVIATLYRSGSFSVVAQGPQGIGSVEFKFDKNQVSLSEILDKLLSEQSGSDVDSVQRRRLVSNILQAHDFYYIPSDDAVAAMRRMKETNDNHPFMHAMRGLLYDLTGPFSRPDTFVEAPDGRLLQALQDLYDREPSSPLAVAIWEMNLNLQGIFNPRAINASIQLDKNLAEGIAETCNGSPLLEKVGIIQLDVKSDEPQPMIKVRIQKPMICVSTKTEDMLAGKETTIWLSANDMNNLVMDRPMVDNSVLHAKVMPQAMSLVGE